MHLKAKPSGAEQCETEVWLTLLLVLGCMHCV
jgi:hypothetical protein